MIESIKRCNFPKVENGKAKDINDFFEQIIKCQFKNKEVIKTIHNSLIEYVNEKTPTFFLRLYGSASKKNWDLLRRGFLTEYPDGKKMVFCDNTFSMLFAGLKIAGIEYTKQDLVDLFNCRNKLVCSFGMTTKEKELCYYYPDNTALKVNLNSKGWYLAHIKPVGKGYDNDNVKDSFPNTNREEWNKETKIRKVDENLSDEKLNLIKAHFIRLIHPLNSFLIPKRNRVLYDGKNIGEENELLYCVQSYLKNEFSKEYEEFDKLSLKYDFKEDFTSITNIEWFSKPVNQKKKKVAKEQNTKKSKLKTNVDVEIQDETEELPINLDNWLKSLGKMAFVEVFYPALKENINITKNELASVNEKFASWKTQARTNRLSTAKSIFKNGLEKEALQIIVDSNADQTVIDKARQYLDEEQSVKSKPINNTENELWENSNH
jgi:hypothetical protein